MWLIRSTTSTATDCDMVSTPRCSTGPTRSMRIVGAHVSCARQRKKERFTSLLHHISTKALSGGPHDRWSGMGQEWPNTNWSLGSRRPTERRFPHLLFWELISPILGASELAFLAYNLTLEWITALDAVEFAGTS